VGIFDGVTTIAEVDRIYKDAFMKRHCDTDDDAYWELSTEHRLALGRVTLEAVKAEGPHRYTMSDVNVTPHELRAWAYASGIAVGRKGRVAPDVIKAYVEDHAPASAVSQ
jgi:hypothetical protein